MKVIDLLNKIANDEEVPTKIKYHYITWEWNEEQKDYIELNGAARNLFTYYLDNLTDCLNDEIEIIEEPKTNFNIGDRVKNIKNMSKLDYCNKYIGLKGTIINIDDSDNGETYFVKFDNGEIKWFKHNELELVEEPKEELEEIELIDIHYVNDKCIFKVYGQSIDETIAIKVNELIENQNKIIRELKANKENE